MHARAVDARAKPSTRASGMGTTCNNTRRQRPAVQASMVCQIATVLYASHRRTGPAISSCAQWAGLNYYSMTHTGAFCTVHTGQHHARSEQFCTAQKTVGLSLCHPMSIITVTLNAGNKYLLARLWRPTNWHPISTNLQRGRHS